MKRIIEGRRYDTAKAQEIASDSYSNPGDFHHWHETLYRTAGGSWFLVGQGGPMSKYARCTGQNEQSGGEELRVLTEEQAREWLEEHECTAALEKHFASAITDA